MKGFRPVSVMVAAVVFAAGGSARAAEGASLTLPDTSGAISASGAISSVDAKSRSFVISDSNGNTLRIAATVDTIIGSVRRVPAQTVSVGDLVLLYGETLAKVASTGPLSLATMSRGQARVVSFGAAVRVSKLTSLAQRDLQVGETVTICGDLNRDGSLSAKTIVLDADSSGPPRFGSGLGPMSGGFAGGFGGSSSGRARSGFGGSSGGGDAGGGDADGPPDDGGPGGPPPDGGGGDGPGGGGPGGGDGGGGGPGGDGGPGGPPPM
jgi:hypothetical protein